MELTIIQKAALEVEKVGLHQGWKAGRQKDEDRHFSIWQGIFLAQVIEKGEDHSDTRWFGQVIAVVIGTRGWTETLRIAKEARDSGKV